MRILAIVLVALFLAAPASAAQTTVDATQIPVYVSIPALGMQAPVVPLGLEDDGAMAAPTDPDTVGWYELGPGIGGPGNAILAGHVDWGGSLRVFGLLRQLVPGDEVVVSDEAGNWFTYRVSWSRMVDADSAPVDEIFAQGSGEELTLITCGGTFDRAIHQYLSRLIVRAVREPVEVREPVDVVEQVEAVY